MALGASKILTMLPSTPHVESVYLDPKSGILAGIPSQAAPLTPEHLSLAFESDVDGTESGDAPSANNDAGLGHAHTLLIDGTTLDPTAAGEVARRVQEETSGGALMLDAPVSGGESLRLFGCSRCICTAILPLLSSGRRHRHWARRDSATHDKAEVQESSRPKLAL